MDKKEKSFIHGFIDALPWFPEIAKVPIISEFLFEILFHLHYLGSKKKPCPFAIIK